MPHRSCRLRRNYSPLATLPSLTVPRVGGTPLASEGVELPPFLCANHGHLGLIFALKSLQCEPLWADTLQSLSAWVSSTAVILPHIREAVTC